MGKRTKKIGVDGGWMFVGGIEVVPEPVWNKTLPKLEATGDDVSVVDVSSADELRGVALRTISGPSLSGTHTVRIVRDEEGRAIEAIISLISDEARRADATD